MSESLAHQFKSGFIVIAGALNVGKSTLLNRLLGQKLAITSKKPQTTRNRILGILHRPQAQLIFIDTPGIHRSANLLNQRIVETALTAFGPVWDELFQREKERLIGLVIHRVEYHGADERLKVRPWYHGFLKACEELVGSRQ